MDRSHPFQLVRKRVNTIENRYTREEKPIVGKPDLDNENEWKLLWASLASAKIAIDKFFKAGGFGGEDMKRTQNFFEYVSCLRKIESFANDIHVLLKAANSPQCRHISAYKFKVNALPAQQSKVATVPQTSKQWKTILENALRFRNANKERTQGDFVIDIKKAKEDTEYLARNRNAIKRDIVVHCEIKILTHIFKTEAENPGTPKAYTYVGVSKLSCLGCQAFFEAFNNAYGTKGSQSKSYWPWQFPPSFVEVLPRTYRLIATHWVESYSGYRAKRVPFAPDSEAQTGSSYDIRDEEALADTIAV